MSDSMNASLGGAGSRVEQLVNTVTTLIHGIFDDLSTLAVTVENAMTTSQPGQYADMVWAALETPGRAILDGRRNVSVAGVGFASEYGQVLPSQPWMAWWVERDGTVKQKHHTLNPSSDAYYDYRHAEWFDKPRRTDERCVSGPYIDSWGTDDFTITAAMPVRVHGSFAGVVAADLAVRRLERAISAQLRAIDTPAVLVNGEDRVVASGIPHLSTGLRMNPRVGGGERQPELARFATAYGWAVVLLSS
ncbi:cache domain-containing protein [Saccharopolyspora hattusasensis]|uniref:cache domain-containing protein n=1 Tax=Saccharopolyspora hattusasensis TaxID=1128679 RepID=UPI003D96BDF2